MTTVGRDTRYIVTNLEGERGKHLYEKLYSARGQAENHIKGWKRHLASVPHVLHEDLRQLAYLAALSQNRIRRGGDALADFYREAIARLGGPSAPPTRSPDPLREMLGAALSLDAGKIRSEADLFI